MEVRNLLNSLGCSELSKTTTEHKQYGFVQADLHFRVLKKKKRPLAGRIHDRSYHMQIS